MRDLLHFEFRRLFRRTSLYICLGVVAAPLVMIMFLMGLTISEGEKIPYYTCMTTMVQYANLSILTVVFTSIFVCEDHARGTEKTIYSLGFSRNSLFFAKFLASATGAVLLYLAVMLFGFLSCLIFGSSPDNADINAFNINEVLSPSENHNIFLYALQQFFIIMALHAFYYMFAQLVQKTGIAIVLGIFVPGMVLTVVWMICGMFSSALHENEEAVRTLNRIVYVFAQYWLPSTMSTMVSFFSFIGGEGGGTNIPVSIIVNTGYVLLFGGLALLMTNKREIKG